MTCGTPASTAVGISPVERLLQHNLLGPDTMLGHCIHVTPAEMDIVKESGTWLVNNPESNMGNAVGCAPVLEFFRRGHPRVHGAPTPTPTICSRALRSS